MGIGIEYRVRLTPRAGRQARAVRKQYRDIRPELGSDFSSELARKLKALQSFNAFEVKFDDIRMLRLNRFPYVLYFAVYEAEALVDVFSILHERQQPDVRR